MGRSEVNIEEVEKSFKALQSDAKLAGVVFCGFGLLFAWSSLTAKQKRAIVKAINEK